MPSFMETLARILGAVPKRERNGICMGNAVAYEVSGIRCLPEFLRGLPNLLPQGSILYLEGTCARDVISFLESHAAADTCKVMMGTIWPRPRFFHVAVTQETMEGLAAISEHHAEPEVFVHVHAYRDGRALMEWYDAFSQELWIARDIIEDRVVEFCKRLGAEYRRIP